MNLRNARFFTSSHYSAVMLIIWGDASSCVLLQSPKCTYLIENASFGNLTKHKLSRFSQPAARKGLLITLHIYFRWKCISEKLYYFVDHPLQNTLYAFVCTLVGPRRKHVLAFFSQPGLYYRQPRLTRANQKWHGKKSSSLYSLSTI